MLSPNLHVLIIGAGTGGLCLAHGLKQAGVSVAVYERHRTRTDGLHGYRVGIDPDGNRALHDCLPADLFKTYVATTARTPHYFNMLTENFEELLSLGPKERLSLRQDDVINTEYSVSRMTLRQVLLTGVEDVVHFGKDFAHYAQRPDGRVEAFFEDDSSVVGDVLIAADGSHSRVRKQYLPHAKLEDTGLTGVTGKVAMTEDTKRLLPPKVLDGVSLVFGPKGYSTIIHVMEFPWDHQGNLRKNIGGNDAELLRRWPGLLYDNTRDYIMWGFGGADRNLPANISNMKGPELQQLVLELTKKWHPDLRELYRLSDPTATFPLKVRTSRPIPLWKTTNITLIGDAIHTMTPGRGVGANTALRDARLLCRHLVKVRDGRQSLLEAIYKYETKMVEYGFDAVRKSRAEGDGNDALHKPVIGTLALTGMRTGMRIINRIPAMKRRMARQTAVFRGVDRDDEN